MIATNPLVQAWMRATGESADSEGLHRYIRWMTERWADYMIEHGRKPGDYATGEDQKRFKKWLVEWAERNGRKSS